MLSKNFKILDWKFTNYGPIQCLNTWFDSAYISKNKNENKQLKFNCGHIGPQCGPI